VEADPYEILGVAVDASEEEIHAAYRRLAKAVHSDKGGSDTLFRAVNDAFQAIGTPSAREHYDRGRATRTQATSHNQNEDTRPVPGFVGHDLRGAFVLANSCPFEVLVAEVHLPFGHPSRGRIVDQRPVPGTPAKMGSEVELLLGIAPTNAQVARDLGGFAAAKIGSWAATAASEFSDSYQRGRAERSERQAEDLRAKIAEEQRHAARLAPDLTALWQADPWRRYQLRWNDNGRWTDRVTNGKGWLVDPEWAEPTSRDLKEPEFRRRYFGAMLLGWVAFLVIYTRSSGTPHKVNEAVAAVAAVVLIVSYVTVHHLVFGTVRGTKTGPPNN
jgi:curved DNA-binding protein CbpA